MSLTVVITGKRGVGKTQLLHELSRSSLRAAVSSESTETKDVSDRDNDENVVLLQVVNKYFNVALKLREIPLRNTDALEDLCFENPNVAGVIVVVSAFDSPNSIDWSSFSPNLAFRLVVCRTGGDFEPEERKSGGGKKQQYDESSPAETKKQRNAKTAQWYDMCVDNKFEFVDYDWVVDRDFTPRHGVEKFGLLADDVEGSERVVQVLFRSNYQDFQPLESTGDRPSSCSPHVTAITRSGTMRESSNNTIFVLAVDVECAEKLLRRVFPDLKKIGASNQSDGKRDSSREQKQQPQVLSGTTFRASLDTTYYSMEGAVQIRVVSSFHLGRTMRDLLVLGHQSYLALIVLVAGRDHLPQLVPHVDLLRKSDLLKPEGGEQEELYLLVDSAECPNSPLLSQWSDNNGFELIEVAGQDKAEFYDAEIGFQGLARFNEVLSLLPWDLTASGCQQKAQGKSSSGSNNGGDAAKKKSHKDANPETGIVVLSMGIDSQWPQQALDSVFNTPDGGSQLVTLPHSGESGAILPIRNRYYSKDVPLFYHQVPSMAVARQLYNRYAKAHTLLIFVDTKSPESVALAHGTCLELLLTERLQLEEETPDQLANGGAEDTTLVTAVVANAAPCEGAENKEEGSGWDAKFANCFDEGWFVELIDAQGEPNRLRDVIEATDWSGVTVSKTTKQLKGAAPTTTTTSSSTVSIDWDKVHGCLPPKGFLMDPLTLKTELLPNKMKFEDLTKRIDLVKKHGHSLPPAERKRQAAYLALRMGEAVDMDDIEDQPLH